jgi:hypothetical protein
VKVAVRGDELAVRRATNARRVAGARRQTSPQPEPGPVPGDVQVIIEDLHQIKGMVEEVMAEALVLDNDDLIAGVGALILHVSDVVATAERVEGGD